MELTGPFSTILIVAAVTLFFLLGIAIMVIMDAKARVPGGFTSNPFTIVGMRRDHPMIAFLTTTILLGIIVALLASLLAALTGALGLFRARPPEGLLARLSEERTAERLRHFHNLPPVDLTTRGAKTACFYCHGDYPHSKEPMIRTLLNMHTQFIGCMTCHSDERKVPERTMALRWLNYSGIAVKGGPYGTDIDPATGYIVPTDDYYSQIVPYSNYQGETALLEYTPDDPETREFAAIHQRLSDQDREAMKKRFHRLIGDKGRDCARCHTDEKKSFVPYRNLGFSERRTRQLTHLNILGLVHKYKEFHIPSLTPAAKPPARDVKAPPQAPPGVTPRDDPREWWRRTYDAPGAAPKDKR